MALTEVKDWACPDCHGEWCCPDVNVEPGHCPLCNVEFTSEKKPRPGGIKPLRPPFES